MEQNKRTRLERCLCIVYGMYKGTKNGRPIRTGRSKNKKKISVRFASLNHLPNILHLLPQHRAKDHPDIHVTIKPAKTAIKILIRVPVSTYSVLVVSFSPNRMIHFVAISNYS